MSGSASLVRVFTAEDRAYAHALLEIEARRRIVAELQAQLADLTHNLNRFAAEARSDSPPSSPSWTTSAGPSGCANAASLASVASPARRQSRPNRRTTIGPPPTPPSAAPGTAATSTVGGGAALAAQIKRVYLELARRYHPDLAKSDEDRTERQEIMLKVNHAFHERDLDTLVAIKRDADAADGPHGLPTVAARLAWSLRELERLDDVIADLNTELATIRTSESGRLWRSFAAGEPVFDRLAVDLRTELNRQRTRLADLTDIQNAISARTKRTARRA